MWCRKQRSLTSWDIGLHGTDEIRERQFRRLPPGRQDKAHSVRIRAAGSNTYGGNEMDYKKAGVDIEAGYKAVELMGKYVKETTRPEVLGGIGGFSGAFSMAGFKGMEEPTLLSGTDGVGTKLKLAFLMDRHDTVGIDCVAMCVNDVACAGGEPLFFLDYIACGKNVPEKIAQIVKGVAAGCLQAGAALVGGETAEMPGFYPEDEYDLAGFAVGIADKKDLITGRSLRRGIPSSASPPSGVHSMDFPWCARYLKRR